MRGGEEAARSENTAAAPLARVRLAFALVAAALLLAGCAGPDAAPESPATPTPAPPPPPPTEGSVTLALGDEWRYVGTEGNTSARIVRVEAGHAWLETTTTRAREEPSVVTTVLNATTLAIAALRDGGLGVELRFEPPVRILVPAENRTHEGALVLPTFLGAASQPIRGEIAFLGPENVTTPAGTFYTYRYAARLSSQGILGFEQTSELWFAPEVGTWVKSVVDGREQQLVAWERAGEAPRPKI